MATKESAVPPAQQFPLHWVDGLIREIRPHVFVREIDQLLILLPNQSYRLNRTGFRLMQALLDGQTLDQVLGGREPPPAVRRDLFAFFTGIAAMVKGCLGEGRDRPEVEAIPYRRPWRALPILSEVALTYRCNLACRFCYAGPHRDRACAAAGRGCPPPATGQGPGVASGEGASGGNGNGAAAAAASGGLAVAGAPSREMSTAEVERVLRIIRQEAQVPSVSFTGGEPTLRDDLPHLVRVAADLGLRVNLISNGVALTTERVARLAAAGLDSAQISLEGPDAETHERLTGVPGLFAATTAAVQALVAAGVPVHTNTTLTGLNVEAAVRMPALVKRLGLDRFSMNMVIPAAWMREAEPALLLTYREIGARVLAVRDAARAAGVRFMWYSPTPYCLFNPIAHNLGNKGCAACDGLLSVDPAGRVIPCSSYFEPQGSLLEMPFQAIWQAPSAVRLREKRAAPARCREGCPTFDLCEGACPLYWQAMGEDELRKKEGDGCLR
jgi:radical SAM protein with 4Fe4S-binding SPASM domain